MEQKRELIETRQRELIALFNTAPIKHIYAMEFFYDKQDSAVFTLPYNPHFDHALGGIHGGVLATMLDNAGWFTAAPHYHSWIATSDLQIRMLTAAAKCTLIATGRLIKAGKRLAVADMELRNELGDLIATGSGCFVITSKMC